MYRLNIRISAEEMAMLQDLKLALFLATDSSVVRHLITEGYAAEHSAIEAAKNLKAASDKRQLKLPMTDAPMGSESVLEGSVGETIARADAIQSTIGGARCEPPTLTLEQAQRADAELKARDAEREAARRQPTPPLPEAEKQARKVQARQERHERLAEADRERVKSIHERRAGLARKKRKQAKERGHKSRGIQIPKAKRGAR